MNIHAGDDDEAVVAVGNAITFDDFLGQMAQTAIEVLTTAHDEDLQMIEPDATQPETEMKRPEKMEPEMEKFKRREELVCQLKKSTKLFWGNEKCHLKDF